MSSCCPGSRARLLHIACRAVGLADGRQQANVLINIGYGDDCKLFDRTPQLAFEQVERFFDDS